MKTEKRILITGVNGGFGKLTVAALLEAGHQIAASVCDSKGRNRQAAEELVAMGAQIVEIDVTQDASVDGGVADAIAKLGGIDVLINNAGPGALGIQETYTPDDWKKVFEINVFGVQRMIRALLPQMKKQQNGLLIQVSSLIGRLTIPFMGPYGASKWAVETLAESYRPGSGTVGIESCIVEPGGFPTTFSEVLIPPGGMDRIEGYGAVGEMPTRFLAAFKDIFAANPEQSPSKVAEAITNLIAKPQGQRPIRTIVDHMGLGTLVHPYNDLLQQSNNQVYENFQIGHLTAEKK